MIKRIGDYPLTLQGNVDMLDGVWRVFLPDGTVHNDKFTARERAQPLLDKLNEANRRKGGRPKKSETIFEEEDSNE